MTRHTLRVAAGHFDPRVGPAIIEIEMFSLLIRAFAFEDSRVRGCESNGIWQYRDLVVFVSASVWSMTVATDETAYQ